MMSQNERIDCLIDKTVDAIANYEEVFNKVNENYKDILAMYLYELSYLKGIRALINDIKCYDSIFPIARSYLEGFSICCYSIEMYNKGELDEFIKKLVIIDLKQDIKIYSALPSNIDKGEKENYLKRWEEELHECFPLEYAKIDSNNKEKSMIDIINNLFKIHQKKYSNIDNKAQFISDELNKVPGLNTGCISKALYLILCSNVHFNVGSIVTATAGTGYYSINEYSKEKATAIVDIIIYAQDFLVKSFDSMMHDIKEKYENDQ